MQNEQGLGSDTASSEETESLGGMRVGATWHLTWAWEDGGQGTGGWERRPQVGGRGGRAQQLCGHPRGQPGPEDLRSRAPGPELDFLSGKVGRGDISALGSACTGWGEQGSGGGIVLQAEETLPTIVYEPQSPPRHT